MTFTAATVVVVVGATVLGTVVDTTVLVVVGTIDVVVVAATVVVGSVLELGGSVVDDGVGEVELGTLVIGGPNTVPPDGALTSEPPSVPMGRPKGCPVAVSTMTITLIGRGDGETTETVVGLNEGQVWPVYCGVVDTAIGSVRGFPQ